MPVVTRREVVAVSAAAAVMGVSKDAASKDDLIDPIASDLDRYGRSGVKASGGPGDTATGSWLEAELKSAGYKTERQVIEVPWFDAETATLTVAGGAATLIPVAIVRPTSKGGVNLPLVRFQPGNDGTGVFGAIALIDLPYARWSSAAAKAVREPIATAFAAGARAVILITNGPTRGALALNAPANAPMFAGPVAVMAPRDATPFYRVAQKAGPTTLRIEGVGGRRDAFNLIGRIDRGARQWMVISTPRSGWFVCGGERGPGVAVWLALARWAASAITQYNLAFVCNTGHEYEYHGAKRALETLVPKPAETAFWLHLGANVATRDWHELGGGALLPLPSADPQRFLVTSENVLAVARKAFAGEPGLEAAYPADQGSAGELSDIVAAGYPRFAGIFGAHRYHHSADDDSRAVFAPLVGRVALACQRLLGTV